MTWLYRIAYPPAWLLCRMLWRLKITKLAPLPEGPIVLCCNHLHAFDCVVLALITRRQVHYMGKKELMTGFIGKMLRALGAYPVDREGNDVKAIRHTLTLLKQGRIIGIFPEGHRSDDGRIQEFHPGAAMFALRVGAALVPVGVCATYRPFSRVRLVVGEAMDLSAYGGRRIESADIGEVTDRLRERVVALVEMAGGPIENR
jgi:1-acyl-sn-glycerol-3-phosphate acyltransferase